jgi:pimeloyl-ACP methyl ester carboxylesterase
MVLSIEPVRLESIASANEPTTDVVFVHGLGGDGYKTWTADSTDDTKYWPKWLARDFSELCVYSLYYPARLTQWTSAQRGKAMPLETRAENLLGYLSAKGIGSRPCIFIAHSLGGLLAKEILRSSETGGVPAHAAIAGNTKAVVFLATPHQGATLSNLAEALVQVRVQGLSLSWVVRWSPHIRDLRNNSPKLRQLYGWYSNNARSLGFATLTLYEQYKILGSPMLVVDEASANPGVEGAVFTPADADHFSIAKPTIDTSPIYVAVKSFL